MLDMHEVISSSLTVPTKKREGTLRYPLFFVGDGSRELPRGGFAAARKFVLERSESFAAQPQALTVPTFMFRKGGVLERSESFASSPQGKFRNRTGSFPSCLL